MGGNSSSERGGGKKRFGPAHCVGAARSSHTGSMRRVTPSISIREEAWPNQVMRKPDRGLRLIDVSVGEEGAQRVFRCAGCSSEEDARPHLEHRGKSADVRRHRVQIAVLLALGFCQWHVYPMAPFCLGIQSRACGFATITRRNLSRLHRMRRRSMPLNWLTAPPGSQSRSCHANRMELLTLVPAPAAATDRTCTDE